MPLETLEHCPVSGFVQEVSDTISYLISFIPSSLRPEQKARIEGLLASLEQKRTCHDKPCQQILAGVTLQLSRIPDQKPRTRNLEIDLSGDNLKAQLEIIYPTLHIKGPENQTPGELEGDNCFACPFCYATRGKFSDMRCHLRNKHHVQCKVCKVYRLNTPNKRGRCLDEHLCEDECLNQLFPQAPRDGGNIYIRCFGQFSKEDLKLNGFVKNASGTPRNTKRNPSGTTRKTKQKSDSTSSNQKLQYATTASLEKRDCSSSERQNQTPMHRTREAPAGEQPLMVEVQPAVEDQSSPTAYIDPKLLNAPSGMDVVYIGSQFRCPPLPNPQYQTTAHQLQGHAADSEFAGHDLVHTEEALSQTLRREHSPPPSDSWTTFGDFLVIPSEPEYSDSVYPDPEPSRSEKKRKYRR